MLRISTALLLLCLIAESQGADKPRMATGQHSLTAEFGDDHSGWDFFHDVTVRSKSAMLTLVVLDDLAKNDGNTNHTDEADSKPHKGGFGDPSDDGTAKWPVRPSGQKPWLATNRKLHGTVNEDGAIQFGVTATRNGKLVSLHFIGRSSFAGASGKVFILSPSEPVLEGTWKLNNPYSNGQLVPGVNGTTPFGR